MRTVFGIGVVILLGLGLAPAFTFAAPMDGSAPILCAVNNVTDCPRSGDCERSSAEAAEVPGFVRIDVAKRLLSTVDGARTSPIATFQRNNGRLMLQGMQNERAWAVIVNEQTGQMSATIGEDDGAIIISGTCIAP